MSRPFSYNDENFTVIGNMLFCHIPITKDIPAGQIIAEVPPAIADRLMFITCFMKTGYGKFVVTNSIPCLRVVLADGTISSAKVTSAGVVTLTAAAKGKLIIDGTLDIECNY